MDELSAGTVGGQEAPAEHIGLEDIFLIIDWPDTDPDDNVCDDTVLVHLLRERDYLHREEFKLSPEDGEALLQNYNLVGQVLSRVVPENLLGLKQRGRCQPGYLLDLRRLRFSRQFRMEGGNAAVHAAMEKPSKRPAPSAAAPGVKDVATAHVVNERAREALTGINVGAEVDNNLYIVDWDETDGEGNPVAEAYSVYFLDGEFLRKLKEAPDDDWVPVWHLYRKGGTQVGALSEDDRNYLGMHGACFVANLASFRRRH